MPTPVDMGMIEQSVEKLHGLFDRCDVEIESVKIRKKMEEASFNLGDVRPLADCIFSILLAARSRGHGPPAVFAELEKVSRSNLARKWKKMEDGTYQAT